MLLIVSENTDVYFNLAAEEYALHNIDKDVLMLWRSKSAVVCGKHQNLCAEVNYGFCKQNGVQVARRLSGGGTVFQDMGNVNFTFIQNLKEGLEKAIDFRRFLDPVRRALASLGVETTYSERNDLLLNGKKISGNAEHVFQKQKRVLHHGTLLFDTNLDSLQKTLHSVGIYEDKAVKSVKSEVINIKSVLPDLSSDEFLENLIGYWESQKHTNRYVFKKTDLEAIHSLQISKYSSEKWTLHYSPNYTVSKTISAGMNLMMEVKAGKIETLALRNEKKESVEMDLLSGFGGRFLSEELSAKFAAELNQLSIETDAFLLL